MKIYRYEHKDTHEGPYHSDLPVADKLLAEPIDIRHLTWEADDYLSEVAWSFESDWKAAFGSRKDLAKWFAGFHEELIAEGFQLVCLEVPTTGVRKAYRGHQVAYHSLKAHGRTVLSPRA